MAHVDLKIVESVPAMAAPLVALRATISGAPDVKTKHFLRLKCGAPFVVGERS